MDACGVVIFVISVMRIVIGSVFVARIVSVCFPHVVDVSVLSICNVLNAFVVVIFMCAGSRVSPNIFGLMFMGNVMLSNYSSSCVLYSTGSDVKSVPVVLSGLRMRLFVSVHVCISCRYDLMFAFAMFMSLCVDVMVCRLRR